MTKEKLRTAGCHTGRRGSERNGYKNKMNFKKIDSSENFLNCRKNQIFSYLESNDFPVELLYYNSYENTNKIVNHFMEQKKIRFNYNSNVLNGNDLKEIPGFNFKTEFYETTEQAIFRIKDLLHKKIVIFIVCDCFYLPHRLDHFNKTHKFHSIFIAENLQCDDSNNYKFKIIDDEFDIVRNTFGKKYKEYYYEESIIKNLLLSTGIIQLDYFENSYSPNIELEKDLFSKKFNEYILNFSDDYNIYEKMKEIKNNQSYDWEDLLRLLYGSRYFFKEFLVYYDSLEKINSEIIFHQINSILQNLEKILNIYLKIKFGGKINFNEFEKKISETYLLEINFFDNIVKYFIGLNFEFAHTIK